MKPNNYCRIRTALRATALAAAGCFGLHTGQAQEAAPPAITPPEIPAPEDWLQRRQFSLHPYVSLQGIYDNNITLSHTAPKEDFIFHVRPGIALHGGDAVNQQDRYILLDYSPDFNFFTAHTGFNTVDQRCQFSGLLPLGRLTVGLAENYSAVTMASVEVADRVEHRVSDTRLTTCYALTGKTALEINGEYFNRQYDDARFTANQEFSSDVWLDYQMTGLLTTAIGATVGVLRPAGFPAQNYQRALARVVYNISAKIDLTIDGGAEVREYDSGRATSVTPVFGIGAIYKPFARTTLGLQAGRELRSSSVDARFDYEDTSVVGTLRQELSQYWTLNLAAGYVNASYLAAQNGVNPVRKDNYYFVRPGLEATVTKHCKAGAFFQYRDNTSSVTAYTFDNWEAGIQCAYAF